MIDPKQIEKPNKYIQIPNTAILDNRGSLSQAWLYFFNTVGESIDKQVAANLPELTEQVLATVEKAILLQEATENNEIANKIANESIVANIEAISNANQAIQASAGEIDSLSKRIGDNDKDIASVRQNITDIESNVSDIDKSVQTNTKAIQDINKTLTTQSSQLTDIEQTLATIEQRLQDLEG